MTAAAAACESKEEESKCESKHEAAMDIVRANMPWSAGAGVLPFPLFDMMAITAVQLKVIKELADLYEVPFSENAAKSIVMSLLGAIGSGTIATVLAVSSFKFIPFVGPFMAVTSLAATSTAITYAVGRVFIVHFETGGNLLDLDPVSIREHFRKEFDKSLGEEKAKEDAKKSEKKK